MARNEPVGPRRILHARFAQVRRAEGPHEWLGQTLFVGAGQRRTDPDHSIFTYYVVR